MKINEKEAGVGPSYTKYVAVICLGETYKMKKWPGMAWVKKIASSGWWQIYMLRPTTPLGEKVWTPWLITVTYASVATLVSAA